MPVWPEACRISTELSHDITCFRCQRSTGPSTFHPRMCQLHVVDEMFVPAGARAHLGLGWCASRSRPTWYADSKVDGSATEAAEPGPRVCRSIGRTFGAQRVASQVQVFAPCERVVRRTAPALGARVFRAVAHALPRAGGSRPYLKSANMVGAPALCTFCNPIACTMGTTCGSKACPSKDRLPPAL